MVEELTATKGRAKWHTFAEFCSYTSDLIHVGNTVPGIGTQGIMRASLEACSCSWHRMYSFLAYSTTSPIFMFCESTWMATAFVIWGFSSCCVLFWFSCWDCSVFSTHHTPTQSSARDRGLMFAWKHPFFPRIGDYDMITRTGNKTAPWNKISPGPWNSQRKQKCRQLQGTKRQQQGARNQTRLYNDKLHHAQTQQEETNCRRNKSPSVCEKVDHGQENIQWPGPFL